VFLNMIKFISRRAASRNFPSTSGCEEWKEYPKHKLKTGHSFLHPTLAECTECSGGLDSNLPIILYLEAKIIRFLRCIDLNENTENSLHPSTATEYALTYPAVLSNGKF
jgi:hypothetical protein